jgi:hypothetical protein
VRAFQDVCNRMRINYQPLEAQLHDRRPARQIIVVTPLAD